MTTAPVAAPPPKIRLNIKPITAMTVKIFIRPKMVPHKPPFNLELGAANERNSIISSFVLGTGKTEIMSII